MAAAGKTQGDCENTKLFIPVVLPDNPAAVSPQKNITGLPRVARDIAADVFNNIQHWNNFHIQGAKITKSIAGLKSNHPQTYPDGLEHMINDLSEVTEQLKGISKALEFLASQMESLVKVHKKPTPLFLSLSNDQLAASVQCIAEAYQAELKVKISVLEDISHTRNESEVMFYAVCWTHQQNITSAVNLKVETLLTETGHRKIS